MITLRVANIRKSVREGFRPFFYFSFQEEAFRNAPHTYFVSAYTTDIPSWQRMILDRTGPHVTFIDVENILSIVRDISYRILSVISLFFIAVSLFAILAILSLFARLRLVESTKRRLYGLFGATDAMTRGSFQMTRSTILALSYICSIVIGTLLWLYVVRSNTFLSFQFSSLVLASVSITIAYIILAWVIRPVSVAGNR
jgi:predicted lysophospholipase L1 biosynthesis ABC-type transport system permease subunit